MTRFARCIDRSSVYADRYMVLPCLQKLLFCLSCYHLPPFFKQSYHHVCHHLIFHNFNLPGFLLSHPYLVTTIGSFV